jgi:hypothetical protein
MFSQANRISLFALLCAFAGLCLMSRTVRSDDKPTTAPVNLALNKPATASATESDEHAASKANDGDDDTRWCADGDSVPQWWQVDLQTPATITGISIKWEFDEKVYKYVVEGSPDNEKWTTLSDQSNTTVSKQTQTLTFDKPAEGIRYVRIRITGLDDGCWASFFEVKVFGK